MDFMVTQFDFSHNYDLRRKSILAYYTQRKGFLFPEYWMKYHLTDNFLLIVNEKYFHSIHNKKKNLSVRSNNIKFGRQQKIFFSDCKMLHIINNRSKKLRYYHKNNYFQLRYYHKDKYHKTYYHKNIFFNFVSWDRAKN